MEGTSSIRTAADSLRERNWRRALALAALLLVAPWLSHTALAQRPAGIRATATVVGPPAALALSGDTVRAVSGLETRQVRVAGIGVLHIRSGTGAAVRVATPAAAMIPRETQGSSERMREMRVTIDYVDS